MNPNCCKKETNGLAGTPVETGIPVKQKINGVDARHCYNSTLDLVEFTTTGVNTSDSYVDLLNAMTEWMRQNCPDAIVFSINFYLNSDENITAEMTIER